MLGLRVGFIEPSICFLSHKPIQRQTALGLPRPRLSELTTRQLLSEPCGLSSVGPQIRILNHRLRLFCTFYGLQSLESPQQPPSEPYLCKENARNLEGWEKRDTGRKELGRKWEQHSCLGTLIGSRCVRAHTFTQLSTNVSTLLNLTNCKEEVMVFSHSCSA